MFAIAGGMPRSGSTLVYQVVCHLVERHLDGVRLGRADLGLLPEYRREVRDNRWRVIKTHFFDPGVKCLIGEGRAAAFYIYRDIRDVLCSMMRLDKKGFEQPFADLPMFMHNDRLWKESGHTLVQRYEAVIGDVPKAVGQMAAHLHVRLEEGEAAAIAALYSIDANRARAKAPEDCPEMLLRRSHIHTGEAGRWRSTLTGPQIEAVRTVCGDWLVAAGYESAHDWA